MATPFLTYDQVSAPTFKGSFNYTPPPPPAFNVATVKDVPTLNAALHAGQINPQQWQQQFKTIQAKTNAPTISPYSPSSILGSALTATKNVGRDVGNIATSVVRFTPQQAVSAKQSILPTHSSMAAQTLQTIQKLPVNQRSTALNPSNKLLLQNAGFNTNDLSDQNINNFIKQDATVAEKSSSVTPKGAIAQTILGKQPIQSVPARVQGSQQALATGVRIPGTNTTLHATGTLGHTLANIGVGGNIVGGIAPIADAPERVAEGASKLADVTGVKAAVGKDTGVNDLIANTKAQNLQDALDKAKQSVPTPRSAFDKHIAPSSAPVGNLVDTSKANAAGAIREGVLKNPLNGTEARPTPKLSLASNEAGSVNLEGVQKMIDKHQAVTKATGDVSDDFDKTVGRGNVIDNETAKSLASLPKLSKADANTLQDFRDAKAAGLPVEKLPAHLQPVNDVIDKLNAAKQSADAEKAELGAHPDLAAKIRAQDPTSYTHRETIGKNGTVEKLMSGRSDRVSSLGTLGRKTSSENKRPLMNVTDEEGNRSTVNIDKNNATIMENGGKKTTNLGNLNLKANKDFLDKELSPYQAKISNLQKEYDTLTKVKTKGGVSDARITALAHKTALLEDPGNMSTLSKAEAKSLHDATLKLKELTRIKETGTNAASRLQTINQKLIDLSNKTNEIRSKYDRAELNNKSFVGKDGKKYTIGEATQKEITKNAGQKYYTNPLVTTHVAYADSQTALQHARFIENTKSVLEDKNLALKKGEGTPPKNMVDGAKYSTYFQNYYLDKRLAEELKDATGGAKEENLGTKALATMSNVLRQSIVYAPIKHDVNMGMGYFLDRGLTKWLNPVAGGRMVKSLGSAAISVVRHDARYNDVLKTGFNLVGSNDSKLAQAVKDQLSDTLSSGQKVEQIAKSLGWSPIRAYKALQHVSVFDVQDVLNLARIDERMKGTLFTKGMSLEDAAKETARYNFQYKVPARVLGSRTGAKVLKGDSPLTYFGPYAYDKYRIAKNIVKDTVNLKHPVQAARAADKIAATVAISALVWPLVDKGVQKATGDKNAHVTAPGVAAIPELARQVIDHQKGLTGAIGSQLSIAQPVDLAAQLHDNTDAFTKKTIWDPNATSAQKAVQIGKWLESQAAPVQKATSAGKNTKTNSIAQKTLAYGLSLAGVSTPKNSPTQTKLESLQYDTLPGVQTQAKAQGAAKNLTGALNTIHQYDAKVMTAAKADLQAQGRPIPDDATLIKQLKASGVYYQPKAATIKGWSKPKVPVKGGFNL